MALVAQRSGSEALWHHVAVSDREQNPTVLKKELMYCVTVCLSTVNALLHSEH